MQLSHEEAAKVARLWQWRSGHLAHATYRPVPSSDWRKTEDVRVVVTQDGALATRVDCYNRPISLATPILTDDATSDGLPRSARAALKDETLVCANDRAGWWVRYLAKTHPYAPVVIAHGKTETEAWLAALLAAPEAE